MARTQRMRHVNVRQTHVGRKAEGQSGPSRGNIVGRMVPVHAYARHPYFLVATRLVDGHDDRDVLP
jgi:hypothetical protein